MEGPAGAYPMGHRAVVEGGAGGRDPASASRPLGPRPPLPAMSLSQQQLLQPALRTTSSFAAAILPLSNCGGSTPLSSPEIITLPIQAQQPTAQPASQLPTDAATPGGRGREAGEEGEPWLRPTRVRVSLSPVPPARGHAGPDELAASGRRSRPTRRWHVSESVSDAAVTTRQVPAS
jgi:hypothetical protein